MQLALLTAMGCGSLEGSAQLQLQSHQRDDGPGYVIKRGSAFATTSNVSVT
jgi:hypothetical protein